MKTFFATVAWLLTLWFLLTTYTELVTIKYVLLKILAAQG